MEQEPARKKVFISYSWSGQEHEDWVLMLAHRLNGEGGGVHVVLDKWDLKEGNDKYVFMEQMVHADDIDRVLMICDRKYAEKADGRKGGVGTETTIISSSVYENAKQEKFIPVATELDENNQPYLPHYLKSTIYIDMSSDDQFEESFEKLLRNIYDRPAHARPKLGNPPKHIFEDTPLTYKMTSMLRGFQGIIDKNPGRLNSFCNEFLEALFESLKSIEVKFSGTDPLKTGEEILEAIQKSTPLRDGYIAFLNKLTKNSETFDMDILTGFLENLHSLTEADSSSGGWRERDFAHFQFMVNELFLYTVGISMQNENHGLLDQVFNSRYFVKRRYGVDQLGEPYHVVFDYRVNAFDDYYNQQNSKSFYSPQADLLVKRIPTGYTKLIITEADLLCSFIAQFKDSYWFPQTYIYRGESSLIPYLSKLASKKNFEKVKNVFDVENAEGFKAKLSHIASQPNNFRGYPRSSSNIPSVSHMLDANKIAIFR
jgi:hypothetical protein